MEIEPIFCPFAPCSKLPMIIKVYADKSGAHAGSNYLMLSGYIDALGKWIALDRAWRRRLAREGLEYFHAVEHNRRRANEDLRYDLLKLCGKHLACGFTIRLEKRSYDNFYIAGHRPKGVQLDTMYGVCYRYLLSFVLTEIPQLLKRVDLQIDIMLEAGARGPALAHPAPQQQLDLRVAARPAGSRSIRAMPRTGSRRRSDAIPAKRAPARRCP
jgi:hypothetical protein